MTPEETLAKRHWGTDICQAARCTARAAYLALDTGTDPSGAEEWWQYYCRKHASQFAERHGLDLPGASAPAAPPDARRAPAAPYRRTM